MSHFTVLVIGKNPEQQLAPYQENNMDDCPREYLQFNDIEEEYRKQYEADTTTKVVMPDGRLLNTWDEEFRKPGQIGTGSNTHEVPAYLEQKEIKMNELYPSFKEYMKDWCGYEPVKFSNPGGLAKFTYKYGYWENPNAKWDWYQLGGRWTGFFKLKPEQEGSTGTPGLLTKLPTVGTADQALKGAIDFDFMRNNAVDKAAQKYDKVMKIIGHLPVNKTWAEIGESMNYSKEARDIYHAQERCKVWKETDTRDFGFFASVDEFIVSREDYLTQAYNDAISSFAFVIEGKWYEKGDMGWWGMVANEKDKGQWAKEFNSMLDTLSDDTLLSLYDCHI